jgi:hypothetical protein
MMNALRTATTRWTGPLTLAFLRMALNPRMPTIAVR